MTKREVVTEKTRVIDREQAQGEGVLLFLERITYFAFGLINSVLFLRFVFKLLGASTAAPFTRFLYDISGIFMVPFRFIFRTDVVEGAVFEWSALIAITIYMLVNWTVLQLLEVLRQSADEITN